MRLRLSHIVSLRDLVEVFVTVKNDGLSSHHYPRSKNTDARLNALLRNTHIFRNRIPIRKFPSVMRRTATKA